MMDGFGMGIGGGFMWVIWILLILVIAGALGGLRKWREPGEKSPRELLDQRFARGDIDEAEYQKRRDILSR
jgi:putative membrane protein